MHLTEDMLQAAIKKAIEHGLLPRRQSADLYSQNKAAMKDILKTALEAANQRIETNTSVLSVRSSRTIPSEYSVFRSDVRAAYVPGIINKRQ